MKTCYRTLIVILTAAFLSCEELINEDNISGETVILSAPSDGTALAQTDIVLSWEPLEGADEYQLQIARPSFGAPLQIVKDSVLTGNHVAVSLDPNSYAWRVKARNSAYETGFSTWSFTIN